MSKRAPKSDGWEITDHLCSGCMGRVLMRSRDGQVEVRCSNCGGTGEGRPGAICWCGYRLKAGSSAQRFQCVAVPAENRTPEMPGEIEVREI